jgi:hypothetical protein
MGLLYLYLYLACKVYCFNFASLNLPQPRPIWKDMLYIRDKALLLVFVKVHRMNVCEVLAEKCSQLHSIVL